MVQERVICDRCGCELPERITVGMARYFHRIFKIKKDNPVKITLTEAYKHIYFPDNLKSAELEVEGCEIYNCRPRHFDLCPECSRKLMEFMKEGKGEEHD